MIYKPVHFKLEELICPHIFSKYGEVAWQFFDDKLLMTLDMIRDNLGPVYVNNWDMGGNFDERGFRCIRCSIVQEAIANNILYVSPHMTGQGVDCDVDNLTASEVRLWLSKNQDKLPFPIRLENSVEWVHIDTRDAGRGKIHLFRGAIV